MVSIDQNMFFSFVNSVCLVIYKHNPVCFLKIRINDTPVSYTHLFPNAKESKLNKVETTKVTSTVPEDAQEGDITLSLDNGLSLIHISQHVDISQFTY